MKEQALKKMGLAKDWFVARPKVAVIVGFVVVVGFLLIVL